MSDKSETSVHMPMNGGGGAADHVINTLGGMNDQHAGMDGAIASKMVAPTALPTGGVGVTDVLVPAMLVLANNTVSKNTLRNMGVSNKVLGGKNAEVTNGGNLANTIALPVGLVLANQYLTKTLRRKPSSEYGMSRRKLNRKSRKSRRFRGKR